MWKRENYQQKFPVLNMAGIASAYPHFRFMNKRNKKAEPNRSCSVNIIMAGHLILLVFLL